MTGGATKYEDRGIIPRALTHIFDHISSQSEYTYTVRISYLEIYNDNGYDLLDPDHDSKELSQLPKVSLLEDEYHNILFKNLGELPATTVDEALNLLFIGDTNRIICETPSNDVSSRSHCIFQINIESKQINGTKIRHSKLNLVDLAGSERVKKTNIAGQSFKEATFINKSLHFLEQVIVALHEQSKNGNKVHIPYRNSMLTSVLRDSIGGNVNIIYTID
jgi:kinesin family protein 6/9